MKNVISYFYNIFVDDIHQTDKMIFFDYGGYRYSFLLYNGDLKKLLDVYHLHLYALKNGIYVHQIILNKDNQIVTLINGNPYILMKLFHLEGKVSLDEIYSFMVPVNSEFNNIDRTNFGELWSKKIDYLEYEISQIGGKYPEIRDSFSYFVGLGESAIQLSNMINKNMVKTINHDRIKLNDTLFDLYNPLNLVVDYRFRDACEYFKHCFFEGKDVEEEIINFVYQSQLSLDEYILFFARMLYPTYYFDLFEDIIKGKDRKKDLKKVISKVDDYQILLKKLYYTYKHYWNVSRIEWLE